MVRSELLQKMCNLYPNVLRKDIERILDIIISEISNALYRDMAVEIRQFGRFSVKNQKARISRNPKSGIKISIPAKRKIKWKCSKILLKRLNKNFTENKISDT